MSEPLHTLKREHRVIERALHALDGLCIRLEWGDRVPSLALVQLVEFIQEFADRFHHAKEETYLFPALERRGIAGKGSALAALESQHEIERELTAKMRHAVEEYRDLDPESRQHFVDAASQYRNHLIAHIQAEDGMLFRLADEMLEETDIAEIKQGFQRAENELSVRTRDEYERLARELEDNWAV